MDRSRLPLTALRAFEAAARHLNVTRAALELRVTQAAVSHHVKLLEEQLGVPLFRRLPRGLMLTDEGAVLVPMLNDTFDRMAATLDRFAGGRLREIVNVGVVGTFATGWLLPRLAEFNALHPFVDLRIMTNNNRVDLAGEGLNFAIRYGDGAWPDPGQQCKKSEGAIHRSSQVRLSGSEPLSEISNGSYVASRM
jgi:LysR family transcriptional regulator of beta-lactamase